MPLSGRWSGPPTAATIAADLAKKSRTPPPPRRVQAPKQRAAVAPAARRRRLLLIAGGVAAIAVIAAGAVLAAVVLGGSSADATLRDAGCTIVKKPALGRQHVAKLAKGFKYNTFPPTTGPHFPTPAPFEFYPEPVEQFRLVHNLEHGAMVVQYGEDVSESTVAQIRDWYLGDPNGIVVAPLPALKDKIALEAWTSPDAAPGQTPAPGEGVVATCPGFDRGAVGAFEDTYAFRGPERFQRSQLTPGP